MSIRQSRLHPGWCPFFSSCYSLLPPFNPWAVAPQSQHLAEASSAPAEETDIAFGPADRLAAWIDRLFPPSVQVRKGPLRCDAAAPAPRRQVPGIVNKAHQPDPLPA